jgi:thiol-disulfide isomerase/thioredoxin
MAISRREALILGAVAAAAGVAGAVAGVLALQSRSGAAELLTARFSDLEGRPRRLLEWQGRALVCNFWATWCAPCLEEVPVLVAAKQHLPAASADIVGIAIDNAMKVGEFALKFKINYSLLIADATALELLRRLGNHGGGLPYTVAMDRRGAFVSRHLGALNQAQLRQLLASLSA